jgi:hypothetical protein
MRHSRPGFSLRNTLGFILLASSLAAAAESPLSSIRISSRLDYNAILITEVDIVFVYELSLVNRFPASKSEWYRQKYDLLASETSGLNVVTVSIPQGFDSTSVPLPARAPEALKVYATAIHEGQDVALRDISAYQRVLIEIDQLSILVSEQ